MEQAKTPARRIFSFFLTGIATLLRLLIAYGCGAVSSPQKMPENYQGPIAEGPVLQAEDYWIYQRADGTRAKAGAGNSLEKPEFPLWVGKIWRYRSTGMYRGRAAQATPIEIECLAKSFQPITVKAGKFEAFECRCECVVIGAYGVYERECGEWTYWYAPQAKNIVKIKTESTASSYELVEYSLSPRDAPPTTFQDFYDRGLAQWNKGSADAAIQDFTEAIRLNPTHLEVYARRGGMYMIKQDFDRAIRDFDEVIRLNSKDGAGFILRGFARAFSGEYARASQDFDKAIELSPKHRIAYEGRGRVRFNQGQFSEAASDFTKAAEIDPADLYNAIWVYIAERNAGKPGKPGLEARARRLDLKKWPGAVIQFYLDKIDEKSLYAAAEDPEPKNRRRQGCEAKLYLAEMKLLNGARDEAILLLRAAEAECPSIFFDVHGARAELKRLGQ
jgi:lipoprotein NlpI